MRKSVKRLLYASGLCLFSACSGDDSSGKLQNSSKRFVPLESTEPTRFCFRNEYSHDGMYDVEELVIDLDGSSATGDYNWIPAEKDQRWGQFRGSIENGVIEAEYEYEQEGQTSSTSISIVVTPTEATVFGGSVELGLNQTLARAGC